MNSPRYSRLAVVLCVSLILTLSSQARQDKVVISTEEETAEDVAQVPCGQSERLKAVRTLFMKMGCTADELLTEKRDGVENVILGKKGQGQGTIVVGAHFDKSRAGCGAIDNWTGIVALTHVYRSLKNVPLQKTLIFVAFGKEEEGLLGSKAMVRGIKKEELNQYCAMINIDSLGMTAPQAAENLSSKTLVNRVEELARRMKMPFSRSGFTFIYGEEDSGGNN
jgi:putative aminopeptidase FrvX